jgi:hypothetical protein
MKKSFEKVKTEKQKKKKRASGKYAMKKGKSKE